MPQDADRFLALSLALQYSWFTTTGRLILEFDLELRGSYGNDKQSFKNYQLVLNSI